MDRKIKIVQFTHSGHDHTVTQKEWKNREKGWNTKKSHARKYMTAKGCLADGDKEPVAANLLFWGEWEPNSEIVCGFDTEKDNKEYPHFLHRPFLPAASAGQKTVTGAAGADCTGGCGTCGGGGKGNICANTDPFVFGDHFLYSLCKQVQKNGNKTPTTNLETGSVILFGSTLKDENGEPYFALDTVFVVGTEYREFNPAGDGKELGGFVPDDYPRIMGFPLLTEVPLVTCYKGASPKDAVSGMYSFVPCHASEAQEAFPRPRLRARDFEDLGDVIRNNLNSSSHPLLVDLAKAKAIWQRVREVIKEQGFQEGVNIEYVTK